ncbi:tape measure protein [Sphingomonas sp. S-NIH.Pt15_0812]|uniref:tape measure protein n=1 Tax=Sphingomonas sp. S-NIH.Pt15_0812 TaxID=1920129 RepID=UPI0013E036A9|nr:tape measure protein [Sphingomonas sp. S-NIH.Pt15_0812]
MPQIDPIILQIRADASQYRNELRATTALATGQLDRQERAVSDLEHQFATSSASIRRSLGSMRQAIAGSATLLAGAFSADRVVKLADGYTSFTNQLKVAGVEGKNLAATQEALYEIAQRNGSELSALGTLYGRTASSAKELGASNADLLKFTSGVSAALRIQGGSTEEASGALLQLSQLLGSARVQAEEFNSIVDGARPILQAVANNLDGAGGSVSKLKALVNDGKVSNTDFFRAFLKGSAQLEAQAAKANLTIGASFTILNNALGRYIGQTDSALSATARISQAIVLLSDNLGLIAPALAAIGVSFAARAVTGSAALASLAASTSLYVKALDSERVVILGSAAAEAQKAEAAAAAARVEVAAIEATIAARRADQAAISQTLALIEAQRIESQKAAAQQAFNSRLNFGLGRAVTSPAADRESQDFRSQLATKRALTAVNAELAASEQALAAAQARSVAATDAATAATARLTLAARAGALASKLFSGALALVGGPVGAAVLGIAALVAAIIHFRSEAREAEARLSSFADHQREATETARLFASYVSQGGNSLAQIGNQAADATPKMLNFAGAVGDAAEKLKKLALARRAELRDRAAGDRATASQDALVARQEFQAASGTYDAKVGYIGRDEGRRERARGLYNNAVSRFNNANGILQRTAVLPIENYIGEKDKNGGRDVEGDLEQVTRQLAIARRRGVKSAIQSLEAQQFELKQYKKYRATGLDPAVAQEAASKDASDFRNATAGANSDRSARTGQRAAAKADRDAAAAARREAAAIRDDAADIRAFKAAERQANNDIAAARAELSGSLDERLKIEKDRIEADRQSRNDELLEQSKQGRFGEGDVQKQRVAELQGLNDQRAVADTLLAQARSRAQADQEALDLTLSELANQRDLLQEQSGLADTLGERRGFELALLGLQRQEEEARLRAVLAVNSMASEAEKKAARERLTALPGIYRGREEAVNRSTEAPGQAYRRSIDTLGKDINSAVEGVAANGLDRLNDGIAEAITGARSLGDAFSNVSKQIIADLLRIAVQQTVIKPLAKALFGDGTEGSSSIIQSIGNAIGGSGKLFGRASGGYVAPGQTVRVNEQGAGVELLRMGSQGGTVIPLGQASAAARSSAGSIVVVQPITASFKGARTDEQTMAQFMAYADARSKQAYQAAVKAAGKNVPGIARTFGQLHD